MDTTGDIGYLPQDPREGDLDVLARDRVLSARGLDTLLADLEKQQTLMAEVADDAARDKAVRRYGELEERFSALGGYAAESEAGRICAQPGPAGPGADPAAAHAVRWSAPPGGTVAHPVRRQRHRDPGSATTLLLDEPTNHLDADSIGWLRVVPAEPHRWAGGDQPRCRAAGRRGEPGLVPGRGAR